MAIITVADSGTPAVNTTYNPDAAAIAAAQLETALYIAGNGANFFIRESGLGGSFVWVIASGSNTFNTAEYQQSFDTGYASIAAAIAAGPAAKSFDGSGNVFATLPYPTVTSDAAAAPGITSFTPSSGVEGSEVVLTGSGFTGALQVCFRGVNNPASSFTVDSNTQITAVVPPLFYSIPTNEISVQLADATWVESADSFTTEPGGISAIAPPSDIEICEGVSGNRFTWEPLDPPARYVVFGGETSDGPWYPYNDINPLFEDDIFSVPHYPNPYYRIARMDDDDVLGLTSAVIARAGAPACGGGDDGGGEVVCPLGSHNNGEGVCIPDDSLEPCADGYHLENGVCVPDEGSAVPSAPGEMRFVSRNASGTQATVRMPALPTGATSLRIKAKLHGAATYSNTNVSGILGGVNATVTGLSVPADYDLVAVAVNDVGDSLDGPPLWVTTLETTGGGGGGGGEEITAPTAPAAPLVTKNCAGSTLVVSNPAWDTNEAHPTSTLEIERSDDGGATWTPVHTFTVAGGTWVDASALKYIAYEYRARGVNSEGESAWSAITTITLQSATLAIVILAPVNAATLAGEQLLRFSLADAGAPGVLTPDIEVSINGKPYNVAPTIETPNACIADNIEAFNTIYVLPFDTRDWNNGAKSIRVEAKGTDGCRAKADRAVTFNNTLKTQIFFRDFLASAAMTGHVIGSASIGVELRARAAGLTLLEANARRRYFMETGTRNGTALDDDFTDEAWNAHSPVVWTRGAGWDEEGTRLARLQLFARVFYASPLSAHVRTREKWTPEFDLSLWETAGLPVVKVRSIATGKHLVFVRNNVDAKVFRYTEDGLAEIVLSPTCPDARDAIESGGKIYIVRATGAVRCYDADSGEATFRDVSPAGETRVAKFIEVVGGKVLLLCTDVNSTRCYDLSFAAPKLLWTLAAVATFAVSNDGKLWLAAGAALYGSDAGTAAPTLVKAFASNVVSFWRPDCGLADGTVMRHDGVGAGGNGWSQVADIGAFAHVARWTGGIPGESIEDDARGVAGGLDTWLTGEMQNGSWLDERELMVPAEVEAEVTKTTALDVFSVETGAASETQPAQRDERLLIGTDAGLFVYTRSVITEAQGAVRLSHDTLQRITPYPQPAPVA